MQAPLHWFIFPGASSGSAGASYICHLAGVADLKRGVRGSRISEPHRSAYWLKFSAVARCSLCTYWGKSEVQIRNEGANIPPIEGILAVMD
jgi:hypothetical protein